MECAGASRESRIESQPSPLFTSVLSALLCTTHVVERGGRHTSSVGRCARPALHAAPQRAGSAQRCTYRPRQERGRACEVRARLRGGVASLCEPSGRRLKRSPSTRRQREQARVRGLLLAATQGVVASAEAARLCRSGASAQKRCHLSATNAAPARDTRLLDAQLVSDSRRP